MRFQTDWLTERVSRGLKEEISALVTMRFFHVFFPNPVSFRPSNVAKVMFKSAPNVKIVIAKITCTDEERVKLSKKSQALLRIDSPMTWRILTGVSFKKNVLLNIIVQQKFSFESEFQTFAVYSVRIYWFAMFCMMCLNSVSTWDVRTWMSSALRLLE